MCRLIFAFAACAAFIYGPPTWADNLERSANGQDVTVKITSPFTILPPGGCIPFQANIRNDRNVSGTWHITYLGTALPSGFGTTVFEQDLTVAANSSGTFDLLVPLPIVSPKQGSTELNVKVSGPGFSGGSLNSLYFAYFYNNNSGSRSPFTIIGKELLGPAGVGPLESLYKDKGMEFYGSEVDTETLPSDWRAYSGVAAILLKDTEWLELNRSQHAAVCDYVAQGGQLILFTNEKADSRAPQLQLPGPNGAPGPYGFGNILLTSVTVLPMDAGSLSSMIEENHAPSALEVDRDFSTWNLRLSAGTITVNAAFILTFVLLFGALVGPINLFVFARGSQRFRLFWTTPLISILASLILIAGILITDGIGGRGKQMIAFYSLPDVSRQAVIQEQVARTAVLFSSHWHNDQNYLITPVSTEAMRGAILQDDEISLRRSNGSGADSPDSYHQEGDVLSGNWFRSRAISGQYLQTARPSRSVLTVLNPDTLDSHQEPPVLLSSFPEELTEVYLIDQKGNYWACQHLEPGQKKACVSCRESDYDRFWNTTYSQAGGKLRPALKKAAKRPGCFYASGLPSANDVLTTLGEIRWQAASGVYLGPWVASSTPGKTP